MSYDFNDADTQRNFDVIPDGTITTVHMTVRPGSAGEDGWLRRSKDGGSEALDCEFVVLDGPFAKRKFWTLSTIAGTTPGHADAANISAGKLRAILESARGIMPDDNGRYGMGMGLLRDVIRVDSNARRTGGRRAARAARGLVRAGSYIPSGTR